MCFLSLEQVDDTYEEPVDRMRVYPNLLCTHNSLHILIPIAALFYAVIAPALAFQQMYTRRNHILLGTQENFFDMNAYKEQSNYLERKTVYKVKS